MTTHSDSRFTDYQRILNAAESKDGRMEITVQFPDLRYLNDFVRLRCAPDLMELELFPNAKEITESFACYHAVKKLELDLSNPETSVFVIGDGSTPRTAATFAFRTNWMCFSIDPALRDPRKWERRIQRLHCYSERAEELGGYSPRTILVFPHAHCPIDDVLKKFTGRFRHVIAMPCCEPLTIKDHPPDIRYDDWGVHSPARTIMISKNV